MNFNSIPLRVYIQTVNQRAGLNLSSLNEIIYLAAMRAAVLIATHSVKALTSKPPAPLPRSLLPRQLERVRPRR